VPINGESLVHRVMHWLAGAGIRDLVLNLHHRPASIASVVGDGTDIGVRVRYSWEQPVLGSAGGPRHALPLLADEHDDDFLIVNGDTLTNLDVGSLLARHRESGALVTMALIPNPNPEKYGGVIVSPTGWVEGFTPRRSTHATSTPPSVGPTEPRSYHFIGVQVAKASAFAELDDGVAAESVNELYPRLMSDNPRSIAAHVCTATFLDIGTPRDYLETSLALAEAEGARLIGRDVQLADSALLTKTVVWDDVTVGAQARLYECIVADGVRLPANVQYARCAIVPADGRIATAGERIDGNLLVRQF
jgi:mannose-1-phosphate guanylyltransferase